MKDVLFFLYSLLIGVGVVLLLAKVTVTPHSKMLQTPTPHTKAEQFSLTKAPSASLKGNIISLSGTVGWQSRIATAPATITSPQSLQQGESIQTQADGTATIQFPNFGMFLVSPQTTIDFIQTLPVEFVISQNQGIVTYTKNGTVPLSIRALDCIVRQEDKEGRMIVSVNTDQSIVRTVVTKGSAKIAYNDSENVSQIQTVDSGETVVFNSNTLQSFFE